MKETPNSWIPSSFTTRPTRRFTQDHGGRDLGRHRGKVDIFVAAVGTGGTITGVYEALAPRKAGFEAIAVEPKDSPVISQTLAGDPVKPGPHKIQGTGAGFVPGNLHLKASDGSEQITECIQVANEDAFAMARRLARKRAHPSASARVPMCGRLFRLPSARRMPEADRDRSLLDR